MINENNNDKYKDFEYKLEIEKAFKRIEKYIIKTPIIKCFYLSKLFNSNIYIKCKHQQITGSFKLRGAANKILLLKEKGIDSIVTASTGNHGSAVSYICNLLKINAHIFIPNSCDVAKKEKIINYGGNFIKIHVNENPNCEDAELKAAEFAKKNNLPYVSPYNDIDVICGQGTISYEINENINTFSGSSLDPGTTENKLNFDEIYVSVGGGGLIGGISGYFKDKNHCYDNDKEYNCKNNLTKTKIIGVQPENSAIMFHSINAGKILSVDKNEVFFADTISDGTAGGQDHDSITFEMCRDNVDEWILLNEEEIKNNLLEFMEKEQQIIEGAAAMVIAACKKRLNKIIESGEGENLKDKNFLLVFCGKNISINKVKKLLI